MKTRLILMIRAPEPSVDPVIALYIALVAAACVTTATAILLGGWHG